MQAGPGTGGADQGDPTIWARAWDSRTRRHHHGCPADTGDTATMRTARPSPNALHHHTSHQQDHHGTPGRSFRWTHRPGRLCSKYIAARSGERETAHCGRWW